MRTGGSVCFPLPIPSTGSTPIIAENLRDGFVMSPRIRAKATCKFRRIENFWVNN